MASRYPEELPMSLSASIYYRISGKITDSGFFFSEASMIDPPFGPAWTAFAYTFAAEGEHYQGLSAYSTAACRNLS